MSKNYLAFVVVYNLLPVDYIVDERVEKIEKTINSAISSAAYGRFEASEGNMLFSFPRDPSVKSAEIPVVVEVKLLNGAVFGAERNAMADQIRVALLSFFSEKRGDVIVSVWHSIPSASCSPRS